jgi:hypothetical protein
VTSGSIDVAKGRWQAADGSKSIDLSGCDPGTQAASVQLY